MTLPACSDRSSSAPALLRPLSLRRGTHLGSVCTRVSVWGIQMRNLCDGFPRCGLMVASGKRRGGTLRDFLVSY
eukprot:607155-Hanusia_phi.AAC.3